MTTSRTTLVSHRFRIGPHLAAGRPPCPVDHLLLLAGDVGLRAVLWPNDLDGSRPRARVRLDEAVEGRNAVLDQAVDELGEYFAGTRRAFSVPLDPVGTSFQLDVWHGLGRIPYGETTTYAKQAAELGRPRSVRAVASANGRNPLSIVLPCHRVVGSDGTLTGFAGGLEAKAWLLAHEGGQAASASRRVSKNDS
jgi:methylated-DNA-[protein]-cysteine S-methyltransferase